jgi:hypothetical protein
MIVKNIQDKKLNIIEQFLIINNEDVFDEIEKIIDASLQIPKLERFSKSELITRANLQI